MASNTAYCGTAHTRHVVTFTVWGLWDPNTVHVTVFAETRVKFGVHCDACNSEVSE